MSSLATYATYVRLLRAHARICVAREKLPSRVGAGAEWNHAQSQRSACAHVRTRPYGHMARRSLVLQYIWLIFVTNGVPYGRCTEILPTMADQKDKIENLYIDPDGPPFHCNGLPSSPAKCGNPDPCRCKRENKRCHQNCMCGDKCSNK